MQQGRPSKYTQELADRICAELAEGKSMRTVCKAEDVPDMTTVFRWLRENESFRQQYTKAKEESADALIEEMLDIADDGSNDLMTITRGNKEYEIENKEVTNRSRLRVDTRKWIASKLKPKKYGDKLDMTTNGKDLPVPILSPIINAIPSNDSNKEGSSVEEKN